MSLAGVFEWLIKMENKTKKMETWRPFTGSAYVDILEMATGDKFSFLGHREQRVGDLFDKTTSKRLFVISTSSGFGAYEESFSPREMKRVNSTS
ncbi:hypothetical protein E5676_scaffold655G00120 [Cucumis melo var. makuwa]|uniref:Uncharacterized protein n=1 Tax=Cucumis melo var. makuwa TaxID=1194695 RepID=A0A5D3E1F8_CUCMM|nr:hypothetical protein E5676_scaffold655G00120 [Cucumis melo var. makuwa]